MKTSWAPVRPVIFLALALLAACTVANAAPPAIPQSLVPMSSEAYAGQLGKVELDIKQGLARVSASAPATKAISDILPIVRCAVISQGSVVEADNRPLLSALTRVDQPEWSGRRQEIMRALVEQIDLLRLGLSTKMDLGQTAKAVDQARSILRSKEFGSDQVPPPTVAERKLRDLAAKFEVWLNKLLSKLHIPTLGAMPDLKIDPAIAQGILIGTLALAAAVIVGLIVKLVVEHYEQGRGRRVTANALTNLAMTEEESSLITSRDYKRLLMLAKQNAASGEYRNGYRLVYLGAIVLLDTTGDVRLNRSWTNWEYLRSVETTGKTEIYVPLQTLTSAFDRIWYGYADVDSLAFDEAVQCYEAILLASQGAFATSADRKSTVMKVRVSKEVIGLIVLLTAFIVGGLIVANPNENGDRMVGSELVKDPSIYNDRASGSRALFEWTKTLGYNPEVDKTDWTHLPNHSTLLVSADPESIPGFDLMGVSSGSQDGGKLSVEDARGVLKWLKSGRTLLLMTSHLPANNLFGGPGGGPGPLPGSGGDDKPTFGDTIGATVQTAQNSSQKSFVPLQPSPLVAGVDSISLSDGANRAARRLRDAVMLFGNIEPAGGSRVRIEPAMMMFAVGKGRIIIIADDYFASNLNLSQADNAALLANIIETSAQRGSDVLFDEYHHGAPSSSPDLWSAMGEPLQAATWQLVLVCVLIIGMVAPRFGAVRVYKQGETRASGEYLTSLAGLYHRAEATIPALEIIYRQFLRDLCERLALPPDVPLERLAEIASKQSRIKSESIKRLLTACETALDRKQLSKHDLLELTKKMEHVKQQLK